MNILFFGDLHIADKPPGGRIDDYAQAILDKVASIGRLCKEHDVEYVFSVGDIFHIKQPNRVSHRLTQALIDELKKFPCRVLAIPGNHDLGPDGLDSIPRQPLGTLEKSGALRLLRGMELIAEEGDIGAQAWLIPRPYDAVADGVFGKTDPAYYSIDDEESGRISKAPRPVIGLAHGSIIGPGDSRPYPYVNVDKIPGIEDYDLFVTGHLHECLGVGKINERTIFANPGSVGRTRRDLATYARTVQVLIVSIKEGAINEVAEVPIPGVAPALSVFGGREVTEEYAPNDDISRFVEALGEGLRADELSTAELLAEFDIEPEVKAQVRRFLEEAS